MKIYVASSWRNLLQPSIVVILREHGHDVYDFRHPIINDPNSSGFNWREIDKNWQNWTPKEYRLGCSTQLQKKAFLMILKL